MLPPALADPLDAYSVLIVYLLAWSLVAGALLFRLRAALRASRSEKLSADPAVRRALDALVPDPARELALCALIISACTLSLTFFIYGSIRSVWRSNWPALARRIDESAVQLAAARPDRAQTRVLGPGWRLSDPVPEKGDDASLKLRVARFVYGIRRWVIEKEGSPRETVVLPAALGKVQAQELLASEPCFHLEPWGDAWLTRGTVEAMRRAFARKEAAARLVVGPTIGTILVGPVTVMVPFWFLYAILMTRWVGYRRRFLAGAHPTRPAQMRVFRPARGWIGTLNLGRAIYAVRSAGVEHEYLFAMSPGLEEGEGDLADSMADGPSRVLRALKPLRALLWAVQPRRRRFPLGLVFAPKGLLR